MKIKSVTFFPNGNTIVFGEDGQQMPELQESWLMLWAKHAEDAGHHITEIKDIQLPNGKYASFFRVDSGYNWRITDF